MSNIFIQTPASQPVVYVAANFAFTFLQRSFNVINVYPAKLQVIVISNPRPPYGQIWPR
jgi:hypothetical protein